MKANILHLLAVSALVALAVAFSACTPGTRIVDYPLIDGANTDNLAVERVEASDTATILHCRGFNRPHFWIRLAKKTTLLADGQRFALIGAEGIEPGEMLWMPDSGDSCFTLKFEPLPKGVKKFDAILGQPGCDENGKRCATPVNWDAIAVAADKDGVEWWVVECERHFDDPNGAVKPSFQFLRSKGRC